MRVAVTDRFVMQQRTALCEHLDDVLVRLENLLAGEDRCGWQETPVAADRVVDREAVPLADDEVFLAVARRGVHGAGAAFERHVLTEDYGHDAIVEGMTQSQVLERHAFHAAQFLRPCQRLGALHHRRRELARDQQCLDTAMDVVELRRAADAQQRVVELRVHRHGLVGRQRPRRRGPDHDTRASRRQRLQASSAARGRDHRPTSKRTSIDGDVRSSYSTSASASAERQSRHQCTGL